MEDANLPVDMPSVANLGLESHNAALVSMWTNAKVHIDAIDPDQENWKIQALPLARVKKIMKIEEFILHELEKDRQREDGIMIDESKPGSKFMIAQEAPIVMIKACELLIQELTTRAWAHTERNRRRTLQRQDLHAAVGESEMYDFLIDIVPRVTNVQSSNANESMMQQQQQQQHVMGGESNNPASMGSGGGMMPQDMMSGGAGDSAGDHLGNPGGGGASGNDTNFNFFQQQTDQGDVAGNNNNIPTHWTDNPSS